MNKSTLEHRRHAFAAKAAQFGQKIEDLKLLRELLGSTFNTVNEHFTLRCVIKTWNKINKA